MIHHHTLSTNPISSKNTIVFLVNFQDQQTKTIITCHLPYPPLTRNKHHQRKHQEFHPLFLTTEYQIFSSISSNQKPISYPSPTQLHRSTTKHHRAIVSPRSIPFITLHTIFLFTHNRRTTTSIFKPATHSQLSPLHRHDAQQTHTITSRTNSTRTTYLYYLTIILHILQS